jgi:ATP-dependent protease HslVU (ClpYQ) peptidase subunit
MTCIAAMTDGRQVVMGADSAGVSGYSLAVRADRKIFRKGSYLIGFTSSFRMGQLLRYKAVLPEPHGDPEEFLATEFVDAIRACFKDGGFASKDKEVEEGGQFLVAFKGLLFGIGSDYQISLSAAPFWSCGCGADLALGAMHALAGRSASPHEAVAGGLAAAEAYSAGVRSPFHFLTSGEDGDARP